MVVLPMAILVGLAAGIGYFRLQQGPVSVNFLGEPIRLGINQGLTGLSATFDDVILTLSESGGLELRLRNLKLEENSGEVVVSAPQAAIGLSAGSFLTLQAAPERVELIEPRILLNYSRKSGLSLDFASGASETGEVTGRVDEVEAEFVPGALDLGGVVGTAARFTRENGGSSSLREVGLRNATVVLVAEGRKSNWQIPRLLVDVERRSDRNVISGAARISSAGRIWTSSLRMEDVGQGKALKVLASIRDVVPSQIAAAVPGAEILNVLSEPMSVDMTAHFSAAGDLLASEIAVELSGTQVQPNGFGSALMTFDAGVLNFAYVPSEQRIELRPSTVRLGEASLQLSGRLGVSAKSQIAQSDWEFEVRAEPSIPTDPAAKAPVVALRGGLVRGRFAAATQLIVLDEASLDVSGGTVRLAGEIDAGEDAGSRIEGSFSGLPVRQLAALWPRGIAPGALGWVRDNIHGGEVRTGTISYLSGRHLEPMQARERTGDARFVVALEADNLEFASLRGWPRMIAPRAFGRFEGGELQVSVPEAVMEVGGEALKLAKGRFMGSDLLGSAPSGQAEFSFEGPANVFRELFNNPVLANAMSGEQFPDGLSGNIAGDATIGFPLDVTVSGEDIGYDIRARLSDGQVSRIFNGEDIKGASLDVHASPQALDVSGEVLFKGVPAKVNWQRIKGGEAGRQPPIRLTATLDNADRKQLGIELDEFVTGDVPVVVTIDNPGQAEQSVHVRADLTNAVLMLGVVAWKKPSGREAFFDFDLVEKDGGKVLSNVRIAKSDIAIEGEIEFDNKGRVKRFEFPSFSLDLVSRLSVTGKTAGDGVWKIAVNGKSYVGHTYFRSLFSVGDAQVQSTAAAGEGYDVTANIETVQGFDDISLRGLKANMSLRGGKLSALSGRAELPGGDPLAFELSRERGRRLIRVDTSDAGRALKLVGVYPNMEGGRLQLEVDLDGSGAAEKTGTLWVNQFRVLGDPVVSEVVGSADESVPAIARKQHVARQVFDFDSLRAPFSVGHGQIVIQDASIKGALLGATLRGKADFNDKVVDLGGTYVLLQGLNNMLAPIPVLGELLSGPRKEGVFGTNYAIRGPMARPQVFVHPLSTLAPGIFREIFQLAPDTQSVSPRDENAGVGKPSARSSSSPAAIGIPVAPGNTIGGWSSETRPN
ncbi:MAG: DUF3971 domain-containing protein [Alphaproteobacteria bacterium]|nr:DUF3971 domain-containing protein [Alphaproteobacteria bacterium]